MIELNRMIRGSGIARPLFDNSKRLGVGAGIAIGAGASALGSMFSGIFGSSAQKSANAANLQIAREQMQYNKEEAERNRAWQEKMYGISYERNTALAQAAQLRAAGLNPQLGSIQAGQGQSFSGAQASYSDLPTQQPVDAMADAIGSLPSKAVDVYSGLADAKRTQADTQRINAVTDNTVQATNNLRITYDKDKLSYNMLQEMKKDIVNMQYWNTQKTMWNSFNEEYNSGNTYWLSKQNQYKLYHILPLQSDLYQNQIGLAAAQTFQAIQNGNYSAEQAKDLVLTRSYRIANLCASTTNYYQQGAAAMINANTGAQMLRDRENAGYFANESNLLKQSAYNQNAQGNYNRYQKWEAYKLLPFVKADLLQRIDTYGSQRFVNYTQGTKNIVNSVTDAVNTVNKTRPRALTTESIQYNNDGSSSRRITRTIGDGIMLH